MLLRGTSIFRDSSTYQAILVEGAVVALRSLILKLGRKQFGNPTKKAAEALNTIEDPERLQELAVRTLTAKSWEELLGLPKRRKVRRRRPKR